MIAFDDLPGAGRIRRGLDDLVVGRESVEAHLLRIARGRLSSLGLPIESAAEPMEDAEPIEYAGPTGGAGPIEDAELALYRELCEEGIPDPYAAYNALLRELDSFIAALEHRTRRLSERHRLATRG